MISAILKTYIELHCPDSESESDSFNSEEQDLTKMKDNIILEED